MSNILLILVLSFSCHPDQDVEKHDEPAYTINKIFDLPEEVEENSGIILYRGLVWTFNDSGGDPVLYGISAEDGTILRRIHLQNCTNHDWEDIAQNSRYIFIGDIGNNEGSRTDLKVYFFEKNKLTDEPEQIIPVESISFSYEDQTDFTPAQYASSYDCEAMIVTDDSVYLFTKDWTSLNTTLYRMPAAKGTCRAEKKSVFNSEGLITGADMKNDTLILSGYSLFNPFILIFGNKENFTSPVRLELQALTGVQVEGVAIKNNKEILISNEKSSATQSLHIIKISE